MDQQQYNDRKSYVEQVRSSFGDRPEKSGTVSYDAEYEETGKKSRSFFKARLLFAVLLFLGFVVLRQTGWSFQEIDADRIQEEISRSISLPESVPKLSDLITVTEDGAAK